MTARHSTKQLRRPAVNPDGADLDGLAARNPDQLRGIFTFSTAPRQYRLSGSPAQTPIERTPTKFTNRFAPDLGRPTRGNFAVRWTDFRPCQLRFGGLAETWDFIR